MPDFVALETWLRGPVPVAGEEQRVEEEDREQAEAAIADEPVVPEELLFDDVCGRVRRFRAMLDDAFDYVQERGTPSAPLSVHVHPARCTQAASLGLPVLADPQLHDDQAVLAVRCGSIDARLGVPLERLLGAGRR